MRSIPTSVAACLLLVFVVRGAEESPPRPDPPLLDLVARYELPAERTGPVDVRWAGDDSIFIVWDVQGVSEHELEEGLPLVRELIPDRETGGWLEPLANLAVSNDWILTGFPANRLIWRDAAPAEGGFGLRSIWRQGHFHDFDLEGSRVALVGLPSAEEYERSNGGLVWIGELNQADFEDWRPIYESDELAENFDSIFARYPNTGSVRFLGNGDLVVYPGPRLEILHLSSTGKVKDRWTARDLVGDEGDDLVMDEVLWGDHSNEEKEANAQQERRLQDSLLIDEVLAFGDDPALIVRRPGEDGAGRHWLLGRLGASIEWFEIPADDLGTYGRLRGDVDSRGRIVLIGTGHGFSEGARRNQSQILILETPLPLHDETPDDQDP